MCYSFSLPDEPVIIKAKLLLLPCLSLLAGTMCGLHPPHLPLFPVPLLHPPLLARLNRLTKDKAWLDAHLLPFSEAGLVIWSLLSLELQFLFKSAKGELMHDISGCNPEFCVCLEVKKLYMKGKRYKSPNLEGVFF